jgi:hypothetical protein
MTRKEFYDYLVKNGCEVSNFEGINRTAHQIEIVNRKNSRYFYIATPINDLLVEPFIIERACIMLGIALPPNFGKSAK